VPIKVCRGLDCQSTNLIEAHIFPKGIARLIRTGSEPTVRLSMERIRQAVPQLGEYDSEILCAKCDGKLGPFDDYVIKICDTFDKKHREIEKSKLFVMENFDGDKFAKGILAILWRASISNRKPFAAISLGPRHQSNAQKVLFGATPLKAFHQYELLAARYVNPHSIGLYTYPVRNRRPLNHYGFSLCGFSIIAKVDARRFHPHVQKCVLNGSDTMNGIFTDFMDTPESKSMYEMILAHEARGDRRI
jgi:hypothetical protein